MPSARSLSSLACSKRSTILATLGRSTCRGRSGPNMLSLQNRINSFASSTSSFHSCTSTMLHTGARPQARFLSCWLSHVLVLIDLCPQGPARCICLRWFTAEPGSFHTILSSCLLLLPYTRLSACCVVACSSYHHCDELLLSRGGFVHNFNMLCCCLRCVGCAAQSVHQLAVHPSAHLHFLLPMS